MNVSLVRSSFKGISIIAWVLILAFLILLPGCAEEPENGQHSGINKYSIDLTYDTDSNLVSAEQKVKVYNNSSEVFDKLVFHVFSNAYKQLETVPVSDTPELAFPEGFRAAGTLLKEVKINGKAVNYSLANTILEIKLDKPLHPQKAIVAEIKFDLDVPVSVSRFGTYKGVTQFTNWYPVLAVYENKKWQARDIYKIGESNYSEIADYDVEITIPKDEIIACTGTVVKEKYNKGETKSVEIRARKVRDFAWVVGRPLEKNESSVDETKLICYTFPGNINKTETIDVAKEIFEYYSDLYGKYPYKELSIVETYLEWTGMEYPQLVTISNGVFNDLGMLKSALAHEIAHQWWYAVVGNDCFNQPWLDESLASYSEVLYLDHIKQKDINEYIKTQEKIKPLVPLTSPVDAFKSVSEYAMTIYNGGSLELHRLRIKVGDERFFNVLRRYYQENMFRNAKTADFRSSLGYIVGNDESTEFFNKISTVSNETDSENIIEDAHAKLKAGQETRVVTGDNTTEYISKLFEYTDPKEAKRQISESIPIYSFNYIPKGYVLGAIVIRPIGENEIMTPNVVRDIIYNKSSLDYIIGYSLMQKGKDNSESVSISYALKGKENYDTFLEVTKDKEYTVNNIKYKLMKPPKTKEYLVYWESLYEGKHFSFIAIIPDSLDQSELEKVIIGMEPIL